MSYQTATIQNLEQGEVGYQLTSDPGNNCYVAARWECKRQQNQMLDCRWYVRQINADGSPVVDAHGQPVTGLAYEQLAVPDIAVAGGMDAVKAQLLDVALGEPDAIRNVPDDIRDAIEAASFSA